MLDNYLKANKRVEALCVVHQINPAAFYKWMSEMATEKNQDRKRLKRLEVGHLFPQAYKTLTPFRPKKQAILDGNDG